MNGGTDIALAIQTASKHMQSSLAGGALRTLVLLTDGRIDQHQGEQHPRLSTCTMRLPCCRKCLHKTV